MNDSPHNLFFLKENPDPNSPILLTGPEFHHIKNVLRKKTGETIYFTDGKGKRYKAIIDQALQNAMVIKIIEEEIIPRHNKINLDLGIVPLKSGRTDFIIEKGTELGVNKFIFFISKFSVIRSLTPPRIEHFKKIALSSMLQSQQYYLPEIKIAQDIQKEFSNYDTIIVGDKEGRDKFVPGVQNIFLIIGPEGGFSSEEIDIFLNNNVKFIPFSKNRLRSETAAIAGIVSIISYYSL